MSLRASEAAQSGAEAASDPASSAEMVEIVDTGEKPPSGEPTESAEAGVARGASGTDVDGDAIEAADDEDGKAEAPDQPAEALEPVAAEGAGEGREAGKGREAGDAGEEAGGLTPGAADATPEASEAPGDLAAVEAAEAAEPTRSIEMSEPVEFAEPVELAEPGPHGHRLLLAGGFIAAGVLILGAAVGIVGALTHGFRKPAPIVTYQTSPVFSLRTGECVNTSGQRFSVVSCAVAHDAEVFASFQLPDSAWPGTTEVRAAANAGCESRLGSYLNPQLALSLASTYVFPDQTAWQAGTRTVICEVRPTSGQLTGSVRSGAGAPA